mmetsp:Transcript_3774/g.9635  ORF Transcript_3774/g.9635 Transcript_3774/m.9635 type:complete len:519 (+) Transcript_3774:1718-3274(+)
MRRRIHIGVGPDSRGGRGLRRRHCRAPDAADPDRGRAPRRRVEAGIPPGRAPVAVDRRVLQLDRAARVRRTRSLREGIAPAKGSHVAAHAPSLFTPGAERRRRPRRRLRWHGRRVLSDTELRRTRRFIIEAFQHGAFEPRQGVQPGTGAGQAREKVRQGRSGGSRRIIAARGRRIGHVRGPQQGLGGSGDHPQGSRHGLCLEHKTVQPVRAGFAPAGMERQRHATASAEVGPRHEPGHLCVRELRPRGYGGRRGVQVQPAERAAQGIVPAGRDVDDGRGGTQAEEGPAVRGRRRTDDAHARQDHKQAGERGDPFRHRQGRARPPEFDRGRIEARGVDTARVPLRSGGGHRHRFPQQDGGNGRRRFEIGAVELRHAHAPQEESHNAARPGTQDDARPGFGPGRDRAGGLRRGRVRLLVVDDRAILRRRRRERRAEKRPGEDGSYGTDIGPAVRPGWAEAVHVVDGWDGEGLGRSHRIVCRLDVVLLATDLPGPVSHGRVPRDVPRRPFRDQPVVRQELL